MELQKHVLRDFLGSLAIAEEVQRETEHHGLVLPDNSRKVIRRGRADFARVRQGGRFSHRQNVCLVTYTTGGRQEDAPH